MTSEELVSTIISENCAFQARLKRMEYAISQNDENFKIVANKTVENVRASFEQRIKDLLIELYKQSLNDNYYFFDNPFSVYKDFYQHHLNEYLEEYLDADESDFIKSELINFHLPIENRIITSAATSMKYDPFVQDIEHFKFSLDKKINFLKDRLFSLGWKTIPKDEPDFDYEGVFPFSVPLEFQKVEDEVKIISEDLYLEEISRIKWNGGTAKLGFIFSMLAQRGYISPPENNNGEINNSAFAKELITHFEINTSPGSLGKYLNINDSKFEETSRTFEKADFELPDITRVN